LSIFESGIGFAVLGIWIWNMKAYDMVMRIWIL